MKVPAAKGSKKFCIFRIFIPIIKAIIPPANAVSEIKKLINKQS